MIATTQQTPSDATGGDGADAPATVQSFFTAMATRNLEAVGALFSDDATWNHRNQDRFAGIHRGPKAILAFIGESVQLTAGTLRPIPQAFMTDGSGRVAVLLQLSASRPDGRTTDDPQMVLFTVEGSRVKSVEHFVGDPAAVTAFWA